MTFSVTINMKLNKYFTLGTQKAKGVFNIKDKNKTYCICKLGNSHGDWLVPAPWVTGK